jgi:predicted RNase H-like HicB family nuclease
MKKTTRTISSFQVVFDREEDGRWIAEVPKLPGVLSYGRTKQEAQRRVSAIALRTLADTVEQGGAMTRLSSLFDYGMAGR